MKNNLNRVKTLFRLVLHVVSWLPQVFTIEASSSVHEFLPLVKKLNRVGDRGPDELCSYVKRLRNSLLLYLSEEHLTKKIEGIALTKDGIPKALGPLVHTIRRGLPGDIRLVLTFLYCTRALRLGSKPEVSSITSPFTGTGDCCTPKGEDFWSALGYTHLSSRTCGKVRFRNYHWTTKSGPTGAHAISSSMADFFNLPPDLKVDLCKLGGKKFSHHLKVLSYNEELLRTYFPRPKATTFRKLTYFPDKEDKVRVIAIGDYFSQTVLRPLHMYLNKVLTKIPQDCTYNQGSFLEKTKEWKGTFYSIDLTAFTDRFPIEFIGNLLEIRFGKEYIQAWKRVMVKYPFSYSGPEGLTGIHYSVGTPMGLYSSWPSTTLAHHYVMYECCQRIHIPFKEAKYVMLGDDILIGDDLLAHTYKDYIQSLGVEFSPLKTHESKTLYEFAKRLVWKGVEVTPFPISSLKESYRRYYRLVNLFLEEEKKGWKSKQGLPRTIVSLYKLLGTKINGNRNFLRKSFLESIKRNSYISELVMRMTKKELTASNVITLIWYKFRSTEFEIRDDWMSIYDSTSVLSSLALECFESSYSNSFKSGKPMLGQSALRMALRILGDEQQTKFLLWPLSVNLNVIPIIYARQHVLRSIEDIKQKAHWIDTVGGGDWPWLLKTMSVPLDDGVFSERNNITVSRAASVLGQAISERINFFSGVSKESNLPDFPRDFNPEDEELWH